MTDAAGLSIEEYRALLDKVFDSKSSAGPRKPKPAKGFRAS